MQTLLSTAILAVGICLLVATGGLRRNISGGFRALLGKKAQKGGLSNFSLLCTTLAASLGTGNIVGVALAVHTGGAGAVFWMAASSLPAMAIKYSEYILAARYKGPIDYIRNTCGKKMAVLFCLAGAAAGLLGFGTLTQSDGVVTLLGRGESDREWTASLLMAALVALVLFGGISRIGAVCSALVPMMAVGYVFCCFVILIKFYADIPAALWCILRDAFSLRAGLGGLVGCVVAGVSRGVFSNEAGLGSAALILESADREDPRRAGLIGQVSVFIDTTAMCTLTGLCLVVSGAHRPSGTGVTMTALAFRSAMGEMGEMLLTVFLCFFALSTILGWYPSAERCFTELTGGRGKRLFCLGYLGIVALTPAFTTEHIWRLCDVMLPLMAVPNLLAVFKLRKHMSLWKCTK